MSDIRLAQYGRAPRVSEAAITAGLAMIRLLVPEQREAEFRRLTQRDRRSLIPDLKWTAVKLRRRCVAKGKLATTSRSRH